ncbi:hypothetical protein [Micromonospora sp. KC213]|uniref:hypothetical protein n=1 Tax=Micromonospora sp. KC213 TaxID=2530378 RepID=UPI0010447B26|nr:hypothetical protein [Micromonospora sp. KC213]TDC43672.1 hypothetical protein E1166_02560 [Micromonospora sp. KC213]
MGRLASAYGQAVAAHRQARERLAEARILLDRLTDRPVPERTVDLVARLGRLAETLTAPGSPAARPAGTVAPVRIGAASTADGRFPLLVPLGAGRHLAVNADARDPRVAVLLRVLVLRLLATTAPGTVRVVGIDPAALGATFLPLRPLRDAGVLGVTATTEAEIAALLGAAEAHALAARHFDRDDQELLLVVAASAPGPRELARLAALTHAGPAAAVCVLLAGYPAAASGQAPPLGATTPVRLDERYAWVGDPPGNPYGDDGAGLAVPVLLDADPPARAVRALAGRLEPAVRAEAAFALRVTLPGEEH